MKGRYELNSIMKKKQTHRGFFYNPRYPITLSDDDWGVQSPPKRKVFMFHYHSQKVIGSLGQSEDELFSGFQIPFVFIYRIFGIPLEDDFGIFSHLQSQSLCYSNENS